MENLQGLFEIVDSNYNKFLPANTTLLVSWSTLGFLEDHILFNTQHTNSSILCGWMFIDQKKIWECRES